MLYCKCTVFANFQSINQSINQKINQHVWQSVCQSLIKIVVNLGDFQENIALVMKPAGNKYLFHKRTDWIKA